jgi:hypothetical protein
MELAWFSTERPGGTSLIYTNIWAFFVTARENACSCFTSARVAFTRGWSLFPNRQEQFIMCSSLLLYLMVIFFTICITVKFSLLYGFTGCLYYWSDPSSIETMLLRPMQMPIYHPKKNSIPGVSSAKLCLTGCAPAISPGQKWWQTVLENKSFMPS